MFLTLDIFLSHFPVIHMSKEEFTDKFSVMYSTKQSLRELFDMVPTSRGKPIIKKPDADKRYINRLQVIEYFYEIIIRNRTKYLTLFYHAYFEFKDPCTMKWDGINLLSHKEDYSVISLQKNDQSRRLIRNLFYLELLDLTKVTNTVKSHVSFWEALKGMYNKLELADRLFAPSSIDLFLRNKRSGEMNYNTLFYLLQAYQPKASIFNPYSIKWIMDQVIDHYLGYKGKSIFTPVLSWGSYLPAFMHSDYQEYVGVDVMPSVCQKVEFLADWYSNKDPKYAEKSTTFYCQPSETLLTDEIFLTKYKNHFDCVLVCPPYYDMEIYHEGPQSVDLYPNYNEWLDMYWCQTVQMCYNVTKKGGIFAMIINDYKTLDGNLYHLVQDLHKHVSNYYEIVQTYYLQNRTSPLRVNTKDRTERLCIYRKL